MIGLSATPGPGRSGGRRCVAGPLPAVGSAAASVRSEAELVGPLGGNGAAEARGWPYATAQSRSVLFKHLCTQTSLLFPQRNRKYSPLNAMARTSVS